VRVVNLCRLCCFACCRVYYFACVVTRYPHASSRVICTFRTCESRAQPCIVCALSRVCSHVIRTCCSRVVSRAVLMLFRALPCIVRALFCTSHTLSREATRHLRVTHASFLPVVRIVVHCSRMSRVSCVSITCVARHLRVLINCFRL
jgi:hypothetical protein